MSCLLERKLVVSIVKYFNQLFCKSEKRILVPYIASKDIMLFRPTNETWEQWRHWYSWQPSGSDYGYHSFLSAIWKLIAWNRNRTTIVLKITQTTGWGWSPKPSARWHPWLPLIKMLICWHSLFWLATISFVFCLCTSLSVTSHTRVSAELMTPHYSVDHSTC